MAVGADSLTPDHLNHCSPEYPDIQPERQVIHIPDIQPEFLFP